MFAPRPRPKLVGIVNITVDSFSDGGRFLEPEAAIAQARKLKQDGADIIELGPASSHPDATKVSAATEIGRLQPVIEALRKEGFALAVDTPQVGTQLYAVQAGATLINDIRGFPDEAVYGALAVSSARLVVMHSIVDATRAVRSERTVEEAFASVSRFFEERLARMERGGIARSRLIVDPGMGFFLSTRSEASLAMLSEIEALKRRFGCPVMISVSRKSFLRNAFARPDCNVDARTLASELFAWSQGVDFIRTHDVAPLDQAIATFEAILAAKARGGLGMSVS
jgi:dihydropteroate synthase type 2